MFSLRSERFHIISVYAQLTSKLSVQSVMSAVRVRGSPVGLAVKVKVKCTLVQALRLCAGSTANRGVEV